MPDLSTTSTPSIATQSCYARNAPVRPDPDASQRQLRAQANERFAALVEQIGDGVLQAPAFKPGEPDDRYAAAVATAAAQYGPPERKSLNRFVMHPTQLAQAA